MSEICDMDLGSNKVKSSQKKYKLCSSGLKKKLKKKRAKHETDNSETSTDSDSSSESSMSSVDKHKKKYKSSKKILKRKRKKSDSDSSSGSYRKQKCKKQHKKKSKYKKKKSKSHKLESVTFKSNTPKEADSKEQSDIEIGPLPAETAKAMAPMTKEEWEKKQSVIRRVYDPETGRNRLVKGDGEILEEIVSKERHKEINKVATLNDGEFYKKKMGLSS